ncbi:hypothetical protein GGS23DRAFT_456734 [Durotheca rogersii]|uniref:uncharacterized protein n=1 Tax=Durotheca rogersii TaxID=419775 RepID=UPI00221F3BFA|nr:uncharacterized protein GGS23DRAFT_456734 [Durotheca rogersii]KAI5864621.1 hypothetical protein GGS23DRAFT_456734 [Durotheca rogersii]
MRKARLRVGAHEGCSVRRSRLRSYIRSSHGALLGYAVRGGCCSKRRWRALQSVGSLLQTDVGQPGRMSGSMGILPGRIPQKKNRVCREKGEAKSACQPVSDKVRVMESPYAHGGSGRTGYTKKLVPAAAGNGDASSLFHLHGQSPSTYPRGPCYRNRRHQKSRPDRLFSFLSFGVAMCSSPMPALRKTSSSRPGSLYLAAYADLPDHISYFLEGRA